MLGWAFKKDTNDSRESASIYVADKLIKNKIKIDVYDPRVLESQIIFDLSEINKDFEPNMINFVNDPIIDISGYNVIGIMTEWDEFKSYNWNEIFDKIKKPAYVFDGRNILEKNEMKNIGFNYIGIGRG